jgi:hypothetical protein
LAILAKQPEQSVPLCRPQSKTAEPALQPAPKPVTLAGDQLVKIILADVHDVLSRDTMFCSFVAYRRVRYSVQVILHLDNIVHMDPPPVAKQS